MTNWQRAACAPLTLILLLAVTLSTAMAQRAPAGLGRAGADTDRHGASAAAATRAIAICSGLWSANHTMADIDAYSPLTAEDGERFSTAIDHEARTVSIGYANDMPPRVVVWRPVLGCTQLPVGATIEARELLPQVAADVRAPDLDAADWPLGDRNARGSLADGRQAGLDAIIDDAAYGGNTWGVIIVSGGRIDAARMPISRSRCGSAGPMSSPRTTSNRSRSKRGPSSSCSSR